MNNIVMMNTKYKMNCYGAVNWFDSDELTLIQATRISNRNVVETIYILGAGVGYNIHSGDRLTYITDTGRGYGGKGELIINNIYKAGRKYRDDILIIECKTKVNEVAKYPVWVMK